MENLTRLTKKQAVFVSLYTGYTFTNFSHIHELAEEVLGRSIFTSEFANEDLLEEIRSKMKKDLDKICYEGD